MLPEKRNYFSLRDQMDDLLKSFFEPGKDLSKGWKSIESNPFALDIIENKDNIIIKGDMPGFDSKDIDIEYNDGVLTISGERKKEKEEENSDYKLVERRYGKFSRSLSIPSYADVSKIKAKVKNGSLNLTIPKKEEAKPKSIKVEVES